jgi:hypothetical protein
MGLPPRKFSSSLWPIKDDLALKMTGENNIPCKCGMVYTGRTGCSIETMIKGNHWHINLYHPDKSVVAEYSINLVHCVQLQNASILAKKSRRMDHIIREVVEIELHPDNIKREDGISE